MSISLSIFTEGIAHAIVGANGNSRPAPRERLSTPAASATPPPDDRDGTDARLLQQMARGDKLAFAALYDRFARPLYALAVRILHDPAEAQDVVHDVFVVLWEKASHFDLARGSAFSWAVTLVRNRAIDRVRMRRRRAERLAAAAPGDLGYPEADSSQGADVAALSDEARAVRAAVASLPHEQKRALELAFFGGLTQEQIAEKLSQPLGTVKARIRRGLLKLRESLAPRP